MNQPTVAYFSAEYAIADDLPIYAGGLGVLAADMVLEAAAENRPFNAVGLVYHLAFTGDDPDQRPMTERLRVNGFEVAKNVLGKPLLVKVRIAKRGVVMQAWVKTWGNTRLILLDTNLSKNAPVDRAICDRLYASDPSLQLAQEICLGFGGSSMLEELGIKPDVYHLNEGHAALAGLAVVLREMTATPGLTLSQAVATVREKLVGTKHTILSGAGILLDWRSVNHQLGPMLAAHGASIDELKEFADQPNGDYSDTKLLMDIVRRANGVSKIHVDAELHDHPTSKLIAITNGVFRGRWAAQNWGEAPLELSDAEIWARHLENKRKLFESIEVQTGDRLDPAALTVVWARRMASYKRPELLISDLKRLGKLARHSSRPIQFLVAGRANPTDTVGSELMKRVIAASERPELEPRFAYLPHYNPVSAKLLVQGADVWLNTPIRGYEACGTSGMKASLNGALQFSTSDGWIDEVQIDPIGWEVPELNPASAIYGALQHKVAPLFYDRNDAALPEAWIAMMRANMELIVNNFTATRMLNDYYAKLYDPPAQ
jgi:alpha-glucan phosphorylase-like protein